MLNTVQIIPAILATSEEEYKNKLEKIKNCPELVGGWVQIDLMDGKFVPNKSIGAEVLKKYPLPFKKEAHLMVNDPIVWIEDLIGLNVERIVFPLEIGQTEEIIKKARTKGYQVGLSLNPKTPVEKIISFLGKIDLVLVMAVEPGFGGQIFIPQTPEKVKQLAGLRREKQRFLIEVDGGINETVIGDLVKAGADSLAAGSFLINGNITENLKKIWQILESGKSQDY